MWRPLLALLLCACGHAAPRGTPPPDDHGGVRQAAASIDVAAIGADVTKFLDGQLGALARADVAAYVAGVAEDVFVLGTATEDVIVGRAALAAAMRADFEPLTRAGVTFEATAVERRLGVAPDGHAAWALDTVSFVVNAPDRRMPIVYVQSTVLDDAAGGWRIVAQHSGVASAPVADMPVPGGVAPSVSGTGAASLLALAAGDLLAPPWPERAILGPALEALPPGTTARARGDVRAVVLPGGTVGWVAANVTLSTFGPPARLLAVFTRGADTTWQLAQAHLSFARPD